MNCSSFTAVFMVQTTEATILKNTKTHCLVGSVTHTARPAGVDRHIRCMTGPHALGVSQRASEVQTKMAFVIQTDVSCV